MYIDIRAQLIPILAAFVALGVGIVVGSMLSADRGLLVEQQVLIEDLEQQFTELRATNEEYRSELQLTQQRLSARDRLLTALLPEVIPPRVGRQRLVVFDVGSPELTEKLSSQLGDWEASTVLVRAGQNWAAELFRNGTKPKQLIPQLAALLTGAADEVEAVNLVVEGRLTEPPAAVLFAVNPDEERLFDPVLAPLAERLEAAGIQVVAVERSGQEATLVDRWCRLGVSTIDNAETPVGLVSLALVVQGRTGHFGTSKWAQSLVPDISSPASKRAVGQ